MQKNVQRWIGSWLDSRRRPKKGGKKYIMGQFSRRFLLCPWPPSLSCPLSFLSPLAPFSLPHHSSHVCINEHAPPPASYYPHPSIGCNGYPCSFHNPSCSRPALFHTPFSLRCFLTCPFLQCVITYIHLRFFLFLFSFLSPVAHSCSPRRRGLDGHLVCT